MHSLRVRLLLLMLVVLVTTGTLAASFASRAITVRFQQYVIHRQEASRARREQMEAMLPQLLALHYFQYGSWEKIDELVQQLGELAEERVLLLDNTGRMIADSAGELAESTLTEEPDQVTPIQVADQTVGAFAVLPIEPLQTSSSEAAYIAQVNRALLWAFLAAGVIAILLTLALTRGILQRVQALTAAVQKMAQGDLKQRVQNGASDEIGQLAHAFNAMADSLAHVEQLRRNMVSDVAHELRTPLSNIRGYLEAVQDGVVEPTPLVVNSLVEESMLLNRLVEDLQELAIADAGQLTLARQSMPVPDLVDKAVQGIQGRLNGSRRLRTELDPNLPAVYIDAERIGQVLRNLLNNAVEYTPQNGAIVIGAHQVDGHVQVNVYNEGQGIAPEHLPNVFERFYRVDHSRSRATGGSGLGLAIVKQLVEAHHGRIWAESVAGSYANFIFTLPVAEGRT